MDCLIKYQKKKIKIEDLYLNSVWTNENLSKKDYNNLHSFFWLFSLDLKSSKKITQTVILNWINSNINYNKSKVLYYTISLLIIGYVIYMGVSAVIRGKKYKEENRKKENKEENK